VTGTLFVPATLAIAVAAFVAGCGSSKAAGDDSLTLRFVWKQSGERLAVDLPPRGKVNRGDVIEARSTLRNAVAQLDRPKGALVGHEVATFRVVSPRKATVRIRLALPGGGFEASGGASAAPWHGPLQVSRGRGRFHGARGTGALRQFFDHSTSVFELRLPSST
jgi:hypothetical protein